MERKFENLGIKKPCIHLWLHKSTTKHLSPSCVCLAHVFWKGRYLSPTSVKHLDFKYLYFLLFCLRAWRTLDFKAATCWCLGWGKPQTLHGIVAFHRERGFLRQDPFPYPNTDSLHYLLNNEPGRCTLSYCFSGDSFERHQRVSAFSITLELIHMCKATEKLSKKPSQPRSSIFWIIDFYYCHAEAINPHMVLNS